MIWRVKINDLVGREDFKSIAHVDRQMIIDAATEKLSRDPYAYGEPLRAPYKGYWRLRVGMYRVVYEIHKQEVVVCVVLVGKRKDDQVYKELSSRIDQVRRSK